MQIRFKNRKEAHSLIWLEGHTSGTLQKIYDDFNGSNSYLYLQWGNVWKKKKGENLLPLRHRTFVYICCWTGVHYYIKTQWGKYVLGWLWLMKGKCTEDECSLVDRSLDALSFTAKAFTFLPAHLHKHSETKILNRQLKLFVFRVVWVPALLQVKKTKVVHSRHANWGVAPFQCLQYHLFFISCFKTTLFFLVCNRDVIYGILKCHINAFNWN